MFIRMRYSVVLVVAGVVLVVILLVVELVLVSVWLVIVLAQAAQDYPVEYPWDIPKKSRESGYTLFIPKDVRKISRGYPNVASVNNRLE